MLETYELNYSNELKRASLLFKLISTLIENQKIKDPSSFNIKEINNDSNISSNIHSYLKVAIDFIGKNYATINVNEIADYIEINSSYLYTIKKIIEYLSSKILDKFSYEKS